MHALGDSRRPEELSKLVTGTPNGYLRGHWLVKGNLERYENPGLSELLDVKLPDYSEAGRLDVMFLDGGREKDGFFLTLDDNTRVWINAETEVRYPVKFAAHKREIYVSGEVYLEVSHRPEAPFTVVTPQSEVTVLGTSFNVKAYVTDPDFFVTLETGKILLTSHSATLGYMEPGEKGVYNRKNGTFQISKSGNIQAHSAWKQKQIVFNNTSMSEVMETLSRWYDVEFSVADSSVLRYEYALVSKNPSLRHILRELAKITPVRFTKKGNVIVVEEKK